MVLNQGDGDVVGFVASGALSEAGCAEGGYIFVGEGEGVNSLAATDTGEGLELFD